MGFGPLRVINEDRVQPGMGFGTHGHRDMEIISYVLDGQLSHQDNIGNGSVISAGRRAADERGARRAAQRIQSVESRPACISCRSGSSLRERGIPASYEQSRVEADAKRGKLALIAGPEGSGAAVTIHQDARVYATLLDGDESAALHACAGPPRLRARGARQGRR